jgi:hypothetical protein
MPNLYVNGGPFWRPIALACTYQKGVEAKKVADVSTLGGGSSTRTNRGYNVTGGKERRGQVKSTPKYLMIAREFEGQI